MATSRKKAQQSVVGNSPGGPAPAAIEYVRITAKNALEDLRHAYQEGKPVLVHLVPHENVGKAFTEALEQLAIEVGAGDGGLRLAGVWSKDDRPTENAIHLTADAIDEQMRRSVDENLPVVISNDILPLYKAWQERSGEERRQRIEAAWRAARAL